MPDFWQFPTGSMGIGPISSIYHARFMRYLTHRNLLDCGTRKVWGVFGDGEMDEPESMSALTLASAREAGQPGLGGQLQPAAPGRPGARQRPHHRRAGKAVPRRGLERHQAGVGQRLGRPVCPRPHRRAGAAFAGTVDGQMQTFAAKDGRFNRDNFFGQNPELAALAQGMTDEQIDRLKRGGHDLVKIHAAYAAAAATAASPR
jgi:pyruvate dehydrogenase E1 component